MANKHTPYHGESATFAKTLVANQKNLLDRFNTITKWVTKNIAYDYIKAVTVAKKRGVLPDPARCWEKRMGICQDIAALTVNMLRSVGIAAYMCVGHADRTYHAWVEATINGKTYRYDHDGEAKKYKREKVY